MRFEKHGGHKKKDGANEKGRKNNYEFIPDRAANLGLVLGEVDVLEDHILAIAHEVFIILVPQITPIRLAIVQCRAAILCVILQLLVDHLFIILLSFLFVLFSNYLYRDCCSRQ